ncbi:4-hydroxytryptamine kinase-like protein [Cladobotryum mycophilum]|uniref:4-hydroxytryptamine kinase-like protein n=1 Tax=Cladobotryum mycophilum TaxID=491253 RepID=A0ABR0SEM5_9HYPO
MATTERESDPIAALILDRLSGTEYACSSLSRVNGGLMNFIYRGTLSRPLPNGATTIIAKHAEEYLSGMEGLSLSTYRSVLAPATVFFFETEILRAVHDQITSRSHDEVEVAVPHVYKFDAESDTQILEDVTGYITVWEFLASRCTQSTSSAFTTRLGFRLGSWVGDLHAWGEGRSPAEIVGGIRENQEAQDGSFDFYYGNPIRRVELFPHLLGDCKEVLEQIRDRAAREQKSRTGKNFGFVHGDVLSRNVLIPGDSVTREEHLRLVIIDWELSQYECHFRECGEVLADLYLLKCFKGADGAMSVIQGFLDGYPPLNEDDIFRTAIYLGFFLLSNEVIMSTVHPKQQIEDLIILARDLVLAGWHKDREALTKTIFGPIFFRATN